jgi:putative membrane protein
MIDYDPHRWVDHLLDIKGSVVRQVFTRVLLCTLWAGLATYFHQAHFPLAVPDKGHVLIGLVLGLLLVFRTNASYDRFWEGRRQWGSIINETRNLGRAASVLLADAPDLLRPVLVWTMALPHATMHALRNGRGLGPPAELLPPDAVTAWGKAGHGPLAAARRITAALAEARRRGVISDIVFVELDRNVQLLIDYVGACERIHRTPLPFAYVVHLRRALILYCYTLPLALLDTFGWGTPVVTLLLGYALFGIEEIGVEIEDPFGADDNDLPLERFCATIERDLRPLLPGPDAGPPAGAG